MNGCRMMAVVCVATAGLIEATLAQAGCLVQDLDSLAGATPDRVGGRTRLCLDGDRLKASLMAEGLQRDHVYSAWWVYFDDVMNCLNPDRCGPEDLVQPYGGARHIFANGSYSGGDVPQGVIGRMASGVAYPTGRLTLTGDLRRFVFGDRSELWLLLLSHGPADRSNASRLARQLLTPEMPELGEPYMGRSEDGFNGEWSAVNVFRYRDLAIDGGRR